MRNSRAGACRPFPCPAHRPQGGGWSLVCPDPRPPPAGAAKRRPYAFVLRRAVLGARAFWPAPRSVGRAAGPLPPCWAVAPRASSCAYRRRRDLPREARCSGRAEGRRTLTWTGKSACPSVALCVPVAVVLSASASVSTFGVPGSSPTSVEALPLPAAETAVCGGCPRAERVLLGGRGRGRIRARRTATALRLGRPSEVQLIPRV